MISTDSEAKMAKSVQRLNAVEERERQTYLLLAFCYLPVSTAAGQQTHLPLSLSLSTGAHLRMLRTKLNVINH